jgi:murein DD-endopeptidase MepM/ murein hydrolase activator NlpD
VSHPGCRWLFAGALVAGCGHAAPPAASRIVELHGCQPLTWPTDGPLSSPFGRRDGRPHEGIDLSVPDGTAVRAACDGVVAYAGRGLSGYGRLVILDHPDGSATVYAHNQRLLVSVGETVARGQRIALSGHSGRATAPHVHFELRLAGRRAVDPVGYLAPPPLGALEARHARAAVRARGP